jgi:NAD(P)-dependent dehydrogenase (short-subunit alcohol dehydrogenase family)
MKAIVITGSSRGIGFGLAREFLRQGCAVVISSRRAEAVGRAAAELAGAFGNDRIFSRPCDVTDSGAVQSLWDASVERFGAVDIWINNAGISHRQTGLADLDPEDLRAAVETNLLGALYGCRAAARGMRVSGSGAIYNMEGLGSDGRRMHGLGLYGATKYAVAYLTDSLADELKGSGVIAGAIRPGMVLTELITSQYTDREGEWRRMERMFRILASEVGEMAPWVARRVLANRRNGARIQYGGVGRMMARMIRSFLPPKKG